MKKSFNLRTAFLAVIALAAFAAIVGYPLPIPHESMAGLGLLPFAFFGEIGVSDLVELVKKQGDSLAAWQKKHDEKIAALDAGLIDMAKKANRPSANWAPENANKGEVWVDTKSRDKINVLTHGQTLTDAKNEPSIGRLMRGIVLGGRADDARELEEERKALGVSSDPSGGYTVAGELATEWIDLLRARMVLSQAGARTVPMNTGSLSMARVTSDPVVTWHGENAAISAAEPTFGQITLNAKTAVCLVKMSLELSQDSANIEQIFQSTLLSAMAGAIDSAGLIGVATNAGAAPSGVVSLADRNKVLAIGAPTNWDFVADGIYELMLDNVPMDSIGAMVAHPALWKKMRKLKTGITNDNTPLTAPDEIAKMRKLWTTAAPLSGGTTATAVIADWRDLLFGVRKDITVRVLQESFLGSNLQIAVLAYARVDFAATRHQSFCTLEGITV
ncbi:MAG: phage major capsid protein [Rhodoferax sp.]|nr:phage major capsid protein [Rhodoferax sp.]